MHTRTNENFNANGQNFESGFVPVPVYDEDDYELFRELLKIKLFEMEAKK